MVTVSDQQILDAIVALGRDATVFAEPAASAAYAGLCSLVASGGLDPNERIVVLITGNGLKDVSAASRAAAEPKRIQPTVKSLREALGI
jgi:threonine synthase